MTGFGTLLRKELVESWRTLRLPIVMGLFLFVGLSSPLLARFLPEILELAADDLGGALPFPIPTPTLADAVDQLVKNAGQFGALAAIVLAMGSVASEVDRGTAAFVLVRPVSRTGFLLAKAAVLAAILAAGVALAVVVGWVYTAILFAPPDPAGWAAMGVLVWLHLAAWAALTFLASAATGSVAAAAGLGFVAFLGLSLAAVVPALGRLTPAGLLEPAVALAAGPAGAAGTTGPATAPDPWLPATATVVLIVVAVILAIVTFRRREL